MLDINEITKNPEWGTAKKIRAIYFILWVNTDLKVPAIKKKICKELGCDIKTVTETIRNTANTVDGKIINSVVRSKYKL